mmetsp:Transcript_129052/g.223018  ORF Transcript_129052/g.223018 Transcript_129052/m.223018 type:complete len:112 (-) Transcript_129052:2029-2364(-)
MAATQTDVANSANPGGPAQETGYTCECVVKARGYCGTLSHRCPLPPAPQGHKTSHVGKMGTVTWGPTLSLLHNPHLFPAKLKNKDIVVPSRTGGGPVSTVGTGWVFGCQRL